MKFGNEKKFLHKASGYLSLQWYQNVLEVIICYYREAFCFICLFKMDRLNVFVYSLRGKSSGEEEMNDTKG